ncbi:MAG: hypothetical protein V4621_07810 [Pseudomonadota bacterium]
MAHRTPEDAIDRTIGKIVVGLVKGIEALINLVVPMPVRFVLVVAMDDDEGRIAFVASDLETEPEIVRTLEAGIAKMITKDGSMTFTNGEASEPFPTGKMND